MTFLWLAAPRASQRLPTTSALFPHSHKSEPSYAFTPRSGPHQWTEGGWWIPGVWGNAGGGGPVSCCTHLLPFGFHSPSDVGAHTSNKKQHLIICYIWTVRHGGTALEFLSKRITHVSSQLFCSKSHSCIYRCDFCHCSHSAPLQLQAELLLQQLYRCSKPLRSLTSAIIPSLQLITKPVHTRYPKYKNHKPWKRKEKVATTYILPDKDL